MATNYEELAEGYDKRYRDREYPGVARTLLTQLAGVEGAVVEVGCGTAKWVALLREHDFSAFGLDRSPAMLAVARARVAEHVARGCATQLPLRSSSCAALLAINAAHHFPSQAAFVHEAARVLSPGGLLLVISLEPQRGDDRWAVYDYWPETRAHDLARFARSAQWREWSAEAGLTARDYGVAEQLLEERSAAELLARGAELKRSTSQLADLTEEAFEAGLQRLREAQRAVSEPLVLIADLRLRFWSFVR
jgi:ubiquinone/menaquinone biosynthesis C-methylase UbiE